MSHPGFLALAAGSILSLMALAALGAAPAESTVVPAAQPALTDDHMVELPVATDPSVSFRIWFQVGSQDDPPGKEGLAALTAALLTEGSTTKLPYEEILDRLFPMAAHYTADVSAEMTIISGRAHRDNVEPFLALLTDAILAPAFKPEDLERLKSETLNYLENTLRYASDEELGKAVLYQTIFRGTPYGHLAEGTIAAVRGITVDDVAQFYRQHYTRDRLVIGIGGSYRPATVARLRADLAALPAAGPARVAPPEPTPIEGRRVVLVEKDAPATAISLGFPIDVVRGTREWYALAIANSWLGERRNSSSHLYQVLREARGLNYGDYSYIEHFPDGGARQLPPQNVARRQQIFEIWIRPVPHAARHFALRAAVRKLAHLVEHGLTREEFELTRRFLKNYVLHYAPTTMERLGYALDDKFYGIDGSHLERFRRRMDDITLEEVNAAVRKHLQAERMVIAVVTEDAAALREALAREASSPYEYPTPQPQAVLDEDRDIAAFPLGIRAEDITLVPVEELFTK